MQLNTKKISLARFSLIRNHFTSNQVLDNLTFKKLLELHEKCYEILDKLKIDPVFWFNLKLFQNNVNVTLL